MDVPVRKHGRLGPWQQIPYTLAVRVGQSIVLDIALPYACAQCLVVPKRGRWLIYVTQERVDNARRSIGGAVQDLCVLLRTGYTPKLVDQSPRVPADALPVALAKSRPRRLQALARDEFHVQHATSDDAVGVATKNGMVDGGDRDIGGVGLHELDGSFLVGPYRRALLEDHVVLNLGDLATPELTAYDLRVQAGFWV